MSRAMITLAVHTGIPLSDILKWGTRDVLTAFDELSGGDDRG